MLNSYFVSALATVAVVGCGIHADDSVSSVDQFASVHLKGGKSAKPSFRDNGLTLTATASLSGLGNEDLVATLAASGIPDARCTNPAGATQPPGQNPASVDVTGSVSIPKEELKNGTLTFSVTTLAPASPIPNAPDCPNRQWTETILDMAFTSATITIEQPVGTLVFDVHCTFDPPTANGAVPSGTVTCVL